MSKREPPSDPWAFLKLEQWTTDEVCFYFRICREQLRRWRKTKGFPEPITPPGARCEWLKSDVLAWAERNKKLREAMKAANDNAPIANDDDVIVEHDCPVCGRKRR